MNENISETQLHRVDDIAVLTIHNTASRNALSATVREGMFRYLTELMGDRKCRAIVVTGAGGYFSSGADVGNMGARTSDFLARRGAVKLPNQSSQPVVALMITGPKPVVTAVEGPAYGAGFAWAIAGDYTVAANNARFCAAQILRGLCPDGALYYTTTARCGPGRARELLLSGRVVGAVEAEKYGLVHELAEPGKALDAAMQVAARFAAVPPIAFALTKSAMTHSYHTLEATFRAEQDYQPVVGLSRDHRESVAAFLEKRKPVFTGE